MIGERNKGTDTDNPTEEETRGRLVRSVRRAMVGGGGRRK